MPSKIDPLVTGETYHVYNRGVDKRVVFDNKKNVLRFYNCLHLFNTEKPTASYRLAVGPSSLEEKLVSVIAYAILPNHYHLILRQEKDGGIGEFMRRVSAGYTLHYNEKHQRSGVLFQGRFKRKLISKNKYFDYVFAYVNENFTVHNIHRPPDICYSSSVHYSGVANSGLIQEPPGQYDQGRAQLIARDIYKKRLLTKAELFE